MVRVKRSVTARRRHKKLLKQTKGMSHIRRASPRAARQAVIRALQYAYRDRRNKKRDLRQLWILRINAAARSSGLTYGHLINLFKKADIKLDRKILAELATNHPDVFAAIVDQAKKINK